MNSIRIVWGTATGPTSKASYDTALAAANIHNFNLVEISSVIPAHVNIEIENTASELGEVGDCLMIVQSKITVESGKTGAAGIGWIRSESGYGIFYEAIGENKQTVRERIKEGLTVGQKLRDWNFCDSERDSVVVEVNSHSAAFATAVVLAVYGRSQPIIPEGVRINKC